MTEDRSSRNKKGKKVRRPDQSRQLDIGDVKITGNVGSGTKITGRDVDVRNIASGDISGDIYLASQKVNIASQPEENLVKKMEIAIDEANLPPDEKNYLRDAVNAINTEIEKGSDADGGLINLVLRSIGKISTDILEILVRTIISSENVPLKVLELVKMTLK